MNFLSCSTRAATGTHCADEKKPSTMSTFSCSSSRTDSSMAISGLLGVGVDRLDLVTFDAGLGVVVEHDLGADILQLGAAARQRAGQVENDADLDFLVLGLGGNRHPQRRACDNQPAEQAGSVTHQHQSLPGKIVHCVCCFC